MADWSGSTTSILTTLGRLLERSETTSIRLDRIEARVDHSASEIAALKSGQPNRPHHFERYAKRALTYGIPALTLYASGSHPDLAQLFRLVLGEGP